MADDPSFEVPVGLFQDFEDLKTKVQTLTAQVEALTAAAAAEPGEASADPEEADAGEPAEDEEAWQFPPFILLLDPPLYDDELRALIEWVEGVLVPGYLAEPSSDARWYHLWVQHPSAVARLHACWLAWQELTDPATCGYTGPSVWQTPASASYAPPAARSPDAPRASTRSATACPEPCPVPGDGSNRSWGTAVPQ